MMPRATAFLTLLSALALLLLVLLLSGRQGEAGLSAKRQLVHRLGLTDLALWTEARYTRHPSQADLFTPFQDYPAAAEHFPAGSVVAAAQPKPTTQVRVEKAGQR